MIEQTVGELLEKHVVLDIEGIDRLYLNAYQPILQTGGGAAYFFKKHRGNAVASTVLMAPMSRGFVKAIDAFIDAQGIDRVHFHPGDNKDTITQQRLHAFSAEEGVLYVGMAQEKYSTFRVVKHFDPQTGASFPWLNRSSVLCNQYYFYLVDADFGPLFIKFASYFPFTARVCLNGHEYAKRQLAREGIAFGHPLLRRSAAVTADPRRSGRHQDRGDGAQVAGPFAASFHARGPCSGLSL